MRAHALTVVPDRGARDGGWRRLGIAGRFRYCMNIQFLGAGAKGFRGDEGDRTGRPNRHRR